MFCPECTILLSCSDQSTESFSVLYHTPALTKQWQTNHAVLCSKWSNLTGSLAYGNNCVDNSFYSWGQSFLWTLYFTVAILSSPPVSPVMSKGVNIWPGDPLAFTQVTFVFSVVFIFLYRLRTEEPFAWNEGQIKWKQSNKLTASLHY